MSNLMEFEIFIEETKRRVSARIGYERNLVVYPVVKNNGVVYQGLIILDPEVNISPSIYLNPYYNRYRNGVLMEDIVDDIIKIYKNNKPVKNFDISQLRNFENAKKKIVMRLVNTEKNIELLRDIPNRPFHDLSIIYNVVVSDFVDEYATILVHNQHLNLWGITEEELYGFAMENSQNILPYRFEDLRTILENAERNVWWEFAGLNMYVLTNRIKINGAVCMVYPQLLKRIADFLEDDLVVIPSSIHEVIIIPEKFVKEMYTMGEMDDMVEEINRTELAEHEVLCDHTYCFKRNEMELVY